jgi:hypothetical protein
VPRIVDLNVTKVVWVAGDTGIANVNSPSAAAITGGKDISRFVVATTAIGATASDTVNERSITDTANVVVPTIGNYEGTLVLFRDMTAGAATTDDLLITFAAGSIGWIVKRVGKASTAAVAAADVVQVYKFLTDNPRVEGGTGEGYLKMTVPLLQQGSFNVAATVAA